MQQQPTSILVDPQRLLHLKRQRIPLKLVPSVYQPPTQPVSLSTQPSHHTNPSLPAVQQKRKQLTKITTKTHPNIQFILGLIGEGASHVIDLQEGDCLNLKIEERWLILQGQVRVVGMNGHSYIMNQGYFFFISPSSTSKIKQVITLRPSRVLRISSQLYLTYLQNYIFLKNSQKIKYLKYCPFFLWGQQLSQQLASCMQMLGIQRDQIIYSHGEQSQYIYFVKQGVVLLERGKELKNKVIGEYQMHYEKNQVSQKETTLIVKKGMVFGIDGVLLKQISQDSNPEGEGNNKTSNRIYTAVSMGRTELYVLHKHVLQTFFSLQDMLQMKMFHRELTKGDLDRICNQYAQMVVKHRSLPKIHKSLSKKNVVLISDRDMQQLKTKRQNAVKIRMKQQMIKKMSIAHTIPQPRHRHKNTDGHLNQNNSSLIAQLTSRLALLQAQHPKNPLLFPQLSSTLTKRKNKVAERRQESQKYIMQWIKGKDPVGKEKRYVRESEEVVRLNKEKQSLFKIRSYRSLVPIKM